MVSGELKIVSSDELGGLGAKEGPGTIYTWTPASLMPLLLPWLAMLLLLMRKGNRSGQAWWIWVALGCVCVLGLGLPGLMGELPSEIGDVLSQLVIALAFGLGALWLIAPSLKRRYRVLTALGMFIVLVGFSLFSYAVREDWGEGWDMKMVLLIALALMTLALVVALSLASLACRRRFTALRFLSSLAGWLLASWTVIMLPFFLPAWLTSDGRVPWTEFGLAVLICAGIGLASILPYLILSFAHPFFGDRLRNLLHLPVADSSLPTTLSVPGAPTPIQ